MSARRAGAILLAAAIALAALVYVNYSLVDEAIAPASGSAGRLIEGEGRLVYVAALPAKAGDRVHANTLRLEGLPVDLYVAEEGAAEAIARGETPSVYRHLDLREPYAPPTTLGEAFRALLRGATPGAVDVIVPEPPAGGVVEVVWALARDPAPAAEAERARDALRGAGALGADVISFRGVSVVHRSMLALQPVLYAAEAASAIVMAGAGVAWWRARRVDPAPEGEPAPAETTEALLEIAKRGGEYLVALRDLLVAVGAVLLILGVFGAWALDQSHVNWTFGNGWETIMQTFLILGYVAIALVWASSMRTVAREVRRWRARSVVTPVAL